MIKIFSVTTQWDLGLILRELGFHGKHRALWKMPDEATKDWCDQKFILTAGLIIEYAKSVNAATDKDPKRAPLEEFEAA